jgi:hypothetical protein
MIAKTAKNLPRKKQVVTREGYFDESIYMGWNLATGCAECDGCGFMARTYDGLLLFGVYANDSSPDGCDTVVCPTCNPSEVLPRDVCRHCSNNSLANGIIPALGSHYKGAVFNMYHERVIPFNGYLCDQCAQTEESEWRGRGNGLRFA